MFKLGSVFLDKQVALCHPEVFSCLVCDCIPLGKLMSLETCFELLIAFIFFVILLMVWPVLRHPDSSSASGEMLFLCEF